MKIIVTKDLSKKIADSYNDFMNSNKTFSKHVLKEINLINENKEPKNITLSKFIKSVYRISEEY